MLNYQRVHDHISYIISLFGEYPPPRLDSQRAGPLSNTPHTKDLSDLDLHINADHFGIHMGLFCCSFFRTGFPGVWRFVGEIHGVPVPGEQHHLPVRVTFSKGSVKSVGLGVHTAPNTGFTCSCTMWDPALTLTAWQRCFF